MALEKIVTKKGLGLAVFLLFPVFLPAEEAPGNRFVFAQIRHAGDWDPAPDVWGTQAPYLRRTTSLDPWPARRVLALGDAAAGESPFLCLAGRGDPSFSDADVGRLRDVLSAGGFLLIDNAEANAGGPFARAARALPARLSGDARWRTVPQDHALYRSFFLLHRSAGRRRSDDDLEGLWFGDRLVAVYCENDLLGALAQDRVGAPLFPCVPDGEAQRLESQKLFVNIVLFSLTGTYKTDAVHQPFLEKKMGSVRP